jgi:3-dehydroquinate synthetase
MNVDEWMKSIRHDKKRTAQSVRLVLLSGPGRVFTREMSYQELADRLPSILSRVEGYSGGARAR